MTSTKSNSRLKRRRPLLLGALVAGVVAAILASSRQGRSLNRKPSAQSVLVTTESERSSSKRPVRQDAGARIARVLVRLLLVATVLAAVGGSFLLALHQLWPSISIVLDGAATVILFLGLILWLFGRRDAGSMSNLGSALVGGIVVAFAVFAFQSISQDRQQVLFTVNFRDDLSRIDLHGQDLSGLYLRNKRLTEAFLKGSNLKGANLERAKLQNADLADSDLEGATLIRADCKGAHFTNADLRNASLSGANMQNALLVRADMRGAFLGPYGLGERIPGTSYQLGIQDFPAADLRGADLRGADLRGAYLNGVNFEQARLEDADLRNPLFFFQGVSVKLKGATANPHTLWPQGFDPTAAGVVQVGG